MTDYSAEIDEILTFFGAHAAARESIQPYKLDASIKLKALVAQQTVAARIDERDYTWKLINAIRYERTSLDTAKNETLERLTTLQVEQQLAAEQSLQTPPQGGNEQ